MQEKELLQIKQLIESAYLSLKEARETLERETGTPFHQPHPPSTGPSSNFETSEGNVVQGSFDGQIMLSGDGKKYPVPANYASKSKLVQGDQLKLTMKHDGAFVFKQIGPVERKRLKGTLFRDDEIEQYRVVADEKSYKVLTASITYFKGEPGDEVIILVPQDSPSEWAAVEHLLKVSQNANPPSSPPINQSHSKVEPHPSGGDSSDQTPDANSSGKAIPLDEIDFVDVVG